jgi:uncharacterized RDD family membrane protein YckC
LSPGGRAADAGAVGAQPAGFWHRYAAWSLDWALLAAPLTLLLAPLLQRAYLQMLALTYLVRDWMSARLDFAGSLPSPLALSSQLLNDPVLAATLQAGLSQLMRLLSEAMLIAFALSTLYFVASEAGPWQATPGKRWAGLRVRAADGGIAGLRRAWLRHLAGVLSWAMLNLGHAIAGWRRDHRALHDLLAGTVVLANGPMPHWVRAWLWLQAALLAALLLAGFAWLGWMLLQIASL